MKVLLIGTGGVGEAIAAIAKKQPWVEQVVLADYNLARAREVQAKLEEVWWDSIISPRHRPF
jgi:saccharopine dehydrogenase-like NADP-dependent oxidoreductase